MRCEQPRQARGVAVEPMLEEPKESYNQMFQSLIDRGMAPPSLVISDSHSGLVAAIGVSFPGRTA